MAYPGWVKLPTVSVIIPAYKSENFIGQAIQSALDQLLWRACTLLGGCRTQGNQEANYGYFRGALFIRGRN
jgi:hypothetical protein